MKSSNVVRLLAFAIILAAACGLAFAQESTLNSPPKEMAIEVMYAKGSILAYQRIGEWTWYGFFRRTAGWKASAGEVPIEAVKIASRGEGGLIKARVTLLRGKNVDKEEFVVDYTLSPEKTTIVRELSDFGIEPFEVQLVRAPATVAEPPAIVNKTKSLQVSVEPEQSTLPKFLTRVLNNSPKPVASFSYYTSVDGVRKLIGAPRNDRGGELIKPGASFERSFRYPMKTSPVSTGEVPPALSNLVFNVTSVVFTDGTYEGDAFDAAKFLAVTAGEKAQLRSFLDLVRSKDFTSSPAEVKAAIINIDAITAEFIQKFPTLTAEEKSGLRELVDLGQDRGEKFFRSATGEPASSLTERLQKRIDDLP